MTDKKEYKIDATGKKLGRLATEIATVLMGKDTPSFTKNVVVDVKVIVDNPDKLNIPEKALTQKQYDRYSGYPGGRTVLSMAQVIEKKGVEEIIRKAVYGMLPANKLRKLRMKNLIISK